MVCNSKRIFKFKVALKKAVKYHLSLNASIVFQYCIENNWEEDEWVIRTRSWIYSCAKNSKTSRNPNYWGMYMAQIHLLISYHIQVLTFSVASSWCASSSQNFLILTRRLSLMHKLLFHVFIFHPISIIGALNCFYMIWHFSGYQIMPFSNL